MHQRRQRTKLHERQSIVLDLDHGILLLELFRLKLLELHGTHARNIHRMVSRLLERVLHPRLQRRSVVLLWNFGCVLRNGHWMLRWKFVLGKSRQLPRTVIRPDQGGMREVVRGLERIKMRDGLYWRKALWWDSFCWSLALRQQDNVLCRGDAMAYWMWGLLKQSLMQSIFGGTIWEFHLICLTVILIFVRIRK